METSKVYSLDEIKEIINLHKDFLSKKYFVDSFLLFGSYAKNKQTPKSDIDLLVNFKHTVDMFDFMDLEEYLSNIFHKKIDLGTPNSLKDFVKSRIMNEAVKL